MRAQLFVNVNLDRLPMSISGITFVDFRITGEVYPKLDNTLIRLANPSDIHL